MPGTYEMEAHETVRNGPAGTIQGGAQALMAELAGERAWPTTATSRSSTSRSATSTGCAPGRSLATGEVIPGALDGTCVRVPIIEPAPDGRIVVADVAALSPGPALTAPG